MALAKSASDVLADRLEPGETCLGAVRFLKPGGVAALSTLGLAGLAGVGGFSPSVGVASPSGQLDTDNQIDLRHAYGGQLALTDRKLLVVPRRAGSIVEVPLAGAIASHADKGRLIWAARTFLVTAAHGRWFVGEAHTMLAKRKQVEDFTRKLERALTSASERTDQSGTGPANSS